MLTELRKNGSDAARVRSAHQRLVAIGIVLLALVPSACLIYVAEDVPQLGHYHDDGLYWTAARSLAMGDGYRIASLPGQPYQTKYPPLYPLALSLVWRLYPSFPDNLAIAAWANWLSVPLFVIASYLVTAQLGIGPRCRFAIAGIIALHPLVTFLGLFFMSDLPFSALTLFSLTLGHSAFRDRSSLKALAAGGVGALAYLTKTAALPLLVIPAFFILHRRAREAVMASATLLPAIIGWHVWASWNKGGTAFLYYTDYVGYYLNGVSVLDLPRMLLCNVMVLTPSAGVLAVYDAYGGWKRTFAWMILGWLVIAAVIAMTRRNGVTLYTLFGAAYTLMLLMWNFPPDARFLLPLMPLVLAGVLSFWRCRRGILTFSVVAALYVIAVDCYAFGRALPGFVDDRRTLRNELSQAFAWISRNAPQDSRVITNWDSLFHLYTGRTASRMEYPSFAYYRDDDPKPLAGVQSLAALSRQGAAYLIRTPDDTYMRPDHSAAVWRYVEQSPAFQPVCRTKYVTIYRVASQ